MPVSRVLLHCGAPKTASTSLQDYFYHHEALLEQHGVLFLRRHLTRGDYDPLHKILLRARRVKGKDEAIREARQHLRGYDRDPAVQSLLLSNESLLGEPFIAGKADFYPLARAGADALKRVFDGYDVQVRFLVRSYERYLPSYYVQYIRRGGCLTFQAFIDAINLESLSWLRPADALRAAFGPERVRILDYDDLVQAPDATLARLLEGFVPRPLPPFNPGTYRRAAAVGGLALDATRLGNRLLTKLSSKPPRDLGMITRNLVLKPLSLLTPHRPLALPPDLADRLAGRYQQDRAQLCGYTNGH
ncbi:MAG: hypothetical protein AAFY02_12870 [Pseudomonadota bacterium]